jgi:hypothetical protein
MSHPKSKKIAISQLFGLLLLIIGLSTSITLVKYRQNLKTSASTTPQSCDIEIDRPYCQNSGKFATTASCKEGVWIYQDCQPYPAQGCSLQNGVPRCVYLASVVSPTPTPEPECVYPQTNPHYTEIPIGSGNCISESGCGYTDQICL